MGCVVKLFGIIMFVCGLIAVYLGLQAGSGGQNLPLLNEIYAILHLVGGVGLSLLGAIFVIG